MKKIFLSILACILYLFCISQNHKFEITFSPNLFASLTPTTHTLTNNDALTIDQAIMTCKYFTDSTRIDFDCIYNGCQNRAQVMSMYLNKMGIKHYKIWNFNPFYISLFNMANPMLVNDKLNLLNTKLIWEFHVAIAVLVKNEKNIDPDTLVFDPAFSYNPLSVSVWLNLQNSSTSYYTFLDPEWYNFVTLQQLTPWTGGCKKDTVNLPFCFPYLITGDFYKYSDSLNGLIAAEMATNEQTTRAANEIIYKMKITDPIRGQLSGIVSNFITFKDILQNKKQLENNNPFNKYLADYRIEYKKSVEWWNQELKKLN